MSKETTQKTKKRNWWMFFPVFFAIIIFTWFVVLLFDTGESSRVEAFQIEPFQGFIFEQNDSLGTVDTIKLYSSEFIKAVVSSEDTNVHVVRVSNEKDLDKKAPKNTSSGKKVKRVFTGKRINIAITGVDSRLGDGYKHADANHVVSINLDSAKIEVISIPRDTYADAGLEDSTGQNKLTVVRGAKGRRAYLREVARIANVDKIHYYVEFGFSQAMGILEWLGYKNSANTLQVLRSRKGLGGDDYQRTYNQGQFMRQMMIEHFGKLTGLLGSVFLRGGFSIVDTDLETDKASQIIDALDYRGFPKSREDIVVLVRPPIRIPFKEYDFTDKNVIKELSKQIEDYNEKHKKSYSNKKTVKVEDVLAEAISSAAQDSAKSPIKVIHRLKTYYSQRAWLQVEDKHRRAQLRDGICTLLADAYEKRKQYTKAQEIRDNNNAEKRFFSIQ